MIATKSGVDLLFYSHSMFTRCLICLNSGSPVNQTTAFSRLAVAAAKQSAKERGYCALIRATLMTSSKLFGQYHYRQTRENRIQEECCFLLTPSAVEDIECFSDIDFVHQ